MQLLTRAVYKAFVVVKSYFNIYLFLIIPDNIYSISIFKSLQCEFIYRRNPDYT